VTDKGPTAAIPSNTAASSASGAAGGVRHSAEHLDTTRLYRRELVVGLVINMVIIPTIIRLAGAPAPATTGDLIADALKATGFAVLFMTIGVTISMRMRGRKGVIPKLLPSGPRWLAHVPRNLLARAALFAIVAIPLLAPWRVMVALLFDLLPMRPVVFVSFNVLYGAVINFVVGPFIIRAAMNDVARGQLSPH
jgi:hypothetical protein